MQIRLDPDVEASIQKISVSSSRSGSEVVNTILRAVIKAEEEHIITIEFSKDQKIVKSPDGRHPKIRVRNTWVNNF